MPGQNCDGPWLAQMILQRREKLAAILARVSRILTTAFVFSGDAQRGSAAFYGKRLILGELLRSRGLRHASLQ